MPKKLSAKEVAKDINAGMSREDVMLKYDLTEKGVDALITKLKTMGMVERPELPRPSPAGDREPPEGIPCPSCGFRMNPGLQECPKCGIILAKVRRQLAGDRPADLKCPKCGRVLDAADGTCKWCDAAAEDSQKASSPDSEEGESSFGLSVIGVAFIVFVVGGLLVGVFQAGGLGGAGSQGRAVSEMVGYILFYPGIALMAVAGLAMYVGSYLIIKEKDLRWQWIFPVCLFMPFSVLVLVFLPTKSEAADVE